MNTAFIHFKNQNWSELEFNNELQEFLQKQKEEIYYIDSDNESSKDLISQLKRLFTESKKCIFFLELYDQPNSSLISLCNFYSRNKRENDLMLYKGEHQQIKKMLAVLKAEAIIDQNELIKKIETGLIQL